MKILAICGSPRKGNTEWMLARLAEHATVLGAESELVLLRRLRLKGCNGCLKCEAGGKEREGVCTIKDDMEDLLPKLLHADVIVFGTPVYFEMLSGLLKNFMDRTCPIWPRLEGKSCAGVAVAEEGIGKAVDNLKTYSSLCRMRWLGQVTALASTPRQASTDRAVERRLQRLARKLVAAPRT